MRYSSEFLPTSLCANEEKSLGVRYSGVILGDRECETSHFFYDLSLFALESWEGTGLDSFRKLTKSRRGAIGPTGLLNKAPLSILRI